MVRKKTNKPKEKESDKHLQEVNQEMYRHNLELAVINKTLSLLKKLYQISLQTLDPVSLSKKVSETVRTNLNMELVHIYLFDEKKDSLNTLGFSILERQKNKIKNIDDFNIQQVSKNEIFKKILFEKEPVIEKSFEEIFGSFYNHEGFRQIQSSSHIKTIIVYPLITSDKSIGVTIFGLNREFQTLNNFEKDSIQNLVDVVAVALDKSLLYEQLKVANEQLKALDKARAEFITIASHQLRTPPATVKWYLSAVLSGDFGNLETETKQAIEKAQRTNNGLISLIDDMLNVSRIERGKMEFLFQETDPQSIADEVFEQLFPISKEKGLELTFIKPQQKLPTLMADKEKLKQVMNNIVDNALKYTKKGKVEIKIYEKEKSINFEVTDTGKGFDDEEKAAIFEKYKRGKDAQNHSAGLGLGMYVGYAIINQHHGKIWATSPGVGKGSTFAFSIPIENNLKQTTLLDLTQPGQIQPS